MARAMHTFYQGKKLLWCGLRVAGGVGEHDFHRAQGCVMVASAGRQSGSLEIFQPVRAPHDRKAGSQAAVLLQLTESVPAVRAVAGPGIL